MTYAAGIGRFAARGVCRVFKNCVAFLNLYSYKIKSARSAAIKRAVRNKAALYKK
jgi:hypothetical protein